MATEKPDKPQENPPTPPPAEDRYRHCFCGERKPCGDHSQFSVGDG